MNQLLNEIWQIVVALWNTGVRFARVAIRVVFGLIVIWPFVLLGASHFGASYSGSAGFTAVVALVPLAAVILLILVYPLVSGVLATLPQGQKFYLWLAVILFGELVIGLYLAVIPVWNNPGLIPVLALLVVVLGMFLILKHQFGWRRGGWFSTALALAIVGVTITFFFSGKKETMKPAAIQTIEQIETPVPAPSMESVREIVRIPLLGEGVPSKEALLLPGAIPPLWYYYFDGPSAAQVHYDDGAVGPITKWFGKKGGFLKFSGPKGQEVIVRAYPPG